MSIFRMVVSWADVLKTLNSLSLAISGIWRAMYVGEMTSD